MATSVKTSTVVTACVGTVITGVLAYAAYFDHRRRTDPEFRKALKRESKKNAQFAKEEAEAEGLKQRRALRQAMDKANAEGYPESTEEVEAYFMQEVAKGEALCQDESKKMDAALCFYKAFKVYPQPRELMGIYDRTIPKPVLDVLAEMIAADPTIAVRTGADNAAGLEFLFRTEHAAH